MKLHLWEAEINQVPVRENRYSSLSMQTAGQPQTPVQSPIQYMNSSAETKILNK